MIIPGKKAGKKIIIIRKILTRRPNVYPFRLNWSMGNIPPTINIPVIINTKPRKIEIANANIPLKIVQIPKNAIKTTITFNGHGTMPIWMCIKLVSTAGADV